MAASILRLCKTFGDLTIGARLCKGVLNTANIVPNTVNAYRGVEKINSTGILIISSRNTTSFFNRLPAEALWKGCTSVSNAGKKRGRGKGIGKKMAKDLNRGQVIGIGKANIVWPGLNAPVLHGRELVKQQKLPEDPEREAKLIQIRNSMGKFRPLTLSPLERGWSGTKMPGRSLGPPDPVGEDNFEGFDCRVLEFKSVTHMRGTMGRTRQMSAFVVTGNKNGNAGFALGKAKDGKTALRSAKNRSAQKLLHIEMYNNHTVYHDFFCQFGKTKIFVKKKPEGFGLVCHRAIKTACEVIGIKDIYAKIEGPTHLQHIIKAFFIGLMQQKTHQMLAEEKKLHVVEFRKERSYLPMVMASPTKCRTKKEIKSDEVLDYTQYAMNDRIVLKKKKYPVFYKLLPSWENHLKKTEMLRNQYKVKINLLAEYGHIQSFYYDRGNTECRTVFQLPPSKRKEE